MYNEYVTKDLGEAAALVTQGCVFKSINWKDGVAYFAFDNLDLCHEVSQKYFFQDLALPVRKFHENLKLIKGKLYASSQVFSRKGGGRHVPGQR